MLGGVAAERGGAAGVEGVGGGGKQQGAGKDLAHRWSLLGWGGFGFLFEGLSELGVMDGSGT